MFDEIRSLRNEEVSLTVQKLLQEKQFMNILSTVFPLIPKDVLRERFCKIKTVKEFQHEWDYPFLASLEATKTKGVTLEGLEKIDRAKPYIYISNHRNIVLDSAFFCIKLMEKGLDTVEIAIGDNLLIFPWIRDLVRLNKSFIVRRNLPVKEMLDASKTLSAYIRHNIAEREQSVWIAQREGRAKNADDRTQPALLKMLNMSGEKSISENFAEINICPLAISYEYDPCDFFKAKEFQMKRDDENYKKQPADDLQNMATDILGYKGKVVFTLAGEINKELQLLENEGLQKNDFVEKIAWIIDKKIHLHYKIFPNNKVAYDLLRDEKRFAAEYTAADKIDFERYVAHQIEKIDLPNKDENFLRRKMLEMYANPLVNHLEAKEL